MGVTVTFVAILELMREGLIDIVQAESYAPLHVRAATPAPALRIVSDNTSPDARQDVTADAAPAPDRADEDLP
jgi:segregation and condensation protein A